MPRVDLVVDSHVEKSTRLMQMSGIFDVQPEPKQRVEWHLDFPIEQREWSVGLIVGPSGSGKSQIAREVFGSNVIQGFQWNAANCLLDDFADGLSVTEITKTLNAVGFASPPAWIRPYDVLSTGQQFRVELARALIERSAPVVMDEFTSTVDRTVAKVGSAAVAKLVRNSERQFVGVTCHYDVIDWLQPCWLLDMKDGRFQWRVVQQRPAIKLDVHSCKYGTWELFAQHHYLSHDLNRVARCYVGLVEGQPAAFVGVLPQPHAKRPGWRESRLVVMPDFQGCGVGMAMSNLLAAAYRAGKRRPYFSVTSHPGLIHARARSAEWKMGRKPTIGRPAFGRNSAVKGSWKQDFRATTSFEYVGEPDFAVAAALGIEPTKSRVTSQHLRRNVATETVV